MPESDPIPALNADIVVVGAGAAGLATGLALAQAGRSVIVAGKLALSPNARTVALFDGSLKFLESLGVRQRLERHAAPLETMRIVDDTGSLFRTPPVDFRASEIGLDAFGFNIENHLLVAELAEAARATPGLTLIETLLSDFRFGPDEASALCADGRRLAAKLFIAADGRNSPARDAAGIRTKLHDYGQNALTAILTHAKPHRETSSEFHTRGGPFTLVPMKDDEQGRHRSSLVWLMRRPEAEAKAALDDAALTAEIEKQAHFILGRMALAGPRGLFPMGVLTAEQLTALRLALAGEAAHVFPPIGAQGLNLGLRDVAHLAEALEGHADPGAPAPLSAYEELRRADVTTRTQGVDMLNRSLLSDLLPVDFLRGAGLVTLAHVAPLRRAMMRRGVLPQSGAPRVMSRERLQPEAPIL